jgi:hypothetical protein
MVRQKKRIARQTSEIRTGREGDAAVVVVVEVVEADVSDLGRDREGD